MKTQKTVTVDKGEKYQFYYEVLLSTNENRNNIQIWQTMFISLLPNSYFGLLKWFDTIVFAFRRVQQNKSN